MSNRPCDKWDRRYLEMALLVRTWSKDPSTKHACVLVRPDKTVCSLGYNGFIRGCPVEESQFAYSKDADHQATADTKAKQQEKYSRVIHGEMNAILAARDQSLVGYTAYVVSGVPCDRCTVHLLQAGITRIVCMDGDSDYWARWGDLAERSLGYMREVGCSFTIIDVNTWQIKRDYIG